ncbi:MAG: bifunctional phosphoribosyl-AMP cyclohydrolase/phosphoribosyl-ATP diphosphatase [Flavobacteriaceae bacterium TMED116]|nr:MAG: bifunctional phosphoribosyl-AMP cyclohydrolase/phosphoribosyl-ATP diphosphatase [Flavobacteriaceae bacterium TMED116]
MKLDFSKNKNGLIPAIIQDSLTKNILMLGYMNKTALDITKKSKKVTFYSRSKNRIWTKGEESGNFLNLISIIEDCDNDTLLIRAEPMGPTCHQGTETCWGEKNTVSYGFLSNLESIISKRKNQNPDKSYTASLFKSGINKISQKLGEEATETIIEAKDENDDLFLNESADLLFHFLVLLQYKGFELNDVVNILKKRNK